MVTVWLPNRDAGWAMPAAEPHESGWIEGGRRTMHELAVAIACTGRRVEFRGEMSIAVLEELSAAAGGVRVELPAEARLPGPGDTVIVNEGVADPRVYARLALSPARAIVMVLGPLGMFGWPFTEEPWTPPDHDAIDLATLARPEHFQGAVALGFELWTHTAAFAAAARDAGADCPLLGRGVPEPFPSPAPERDIDVLMLERSHWPGASRRLAEQLEGVVTLPVSARSEVLETLGRTRVVAHPARIEANSRICAEARAMGAVPVISSSNPLAALDERYGAVMAQSVEEIPSAVRDLLADRKRLESLSARGIETGRAEVAWDPYVERIDAALSSTRAADRGHGARAGLGAALRADADGFDGTEHVLGATRAELAQHREWLAATNASLSWRLTAPLRAAKRRLRRGPPG
jgi:hypothetical protein